MIHAPNITIAMNRQKAKYSLKKMGLLTKNAKSFAKHAEAMAIQTLQHIKAVAIYASESIPATILLFHFITSIEEIAIDKIKA
ncbi:hypothetical protein HYD_6160 [Candidatus Hydrogenosomobacter endosymbioticus]|uniref:Uncharacterized protein n=1 Tax=Candidatus Hydrogenosomobacter endosymbioticus TaxID=2558174 RepID=A0ABN6L3K0_9PROT|nr:hypothetical protein HYD_6160 [Candidatus Hydrogenosomobacter endosymbioticus]